MCVIFFSIYLRVIMETWTIGTYSSWPLTTGKDEGGCQEGSALALRLRSFAVAVSSPGEAHPPSFDGYCQLQCHLL